MYRLFIRHCCLGKLLTSILNSRLTNVGILGENQAGFRGGYSTLDHIFTLKCIIDILIPGTYPRKARCIVLLLTIKKAFCLKNRSVLLTKLISQSVNGKVVNVIFNLYKGTKSCIKTNNAVSRFCSCNLGVRQGKHLSPLLFAIFLDDLEMSLRNDGVSGLELINTQVTKYLSNDDNEMWLRLYADDTIVMSESTAHLQTALNSLHTLAANTSKTKTVIFFLRKKNQKSHRFLLWY